MKRGCPDDEEVVHAGPDFTCSEIANATTIFRLSVFVPRPQHCSGEGQGRRSRSKIKDPSVGQP